jgi:transcriptional regulator with XRE-family HTH domain
VDDLSTRLAANLKRMREARDLSQKALAEHSGVPRPTIAHLEAGQANPTLSVVLRVARALGITIDQLVEPGEAPVRVLTTKTLPTERSARMRRVRVVEPGIVQGGAVERVTLKAGGRLHLEPMEGSVEVLSCERGSFELVTGPLSVPLEEEQVAVIRAATDCVALTGGVVYRVAGR